MIRLMDNNPMEYVVINLWAHIRIRHLRLNTQDRWFKRQIIGNNSRIPFIFHKHTLDFPLHAEPERPADRYRERALIIKPLAIPDY